MKAYYATTLATEPVSSEWGKWAHPVYLAPEADAELSRLNANISELEKDSAVSALTDLSNYLLENGDLVQAIATGCRCMSCHVWAVVNNKGERLIEEDTLEELLKTIRSRIDSNVPGNK